MILVYILSGNLLAKIIHHRINFIVLYTMPACRKGAFLAVKHAELRNRKAQRMEDQIQQDNTDAHVRMAQLHQAELEDARAEGNEQRRL